MVCDGKESSVLTGISQFSNNFTLSLCCGAICCGWSQGDDRHQRFCKRKACGKWCYCCLLLLFAYVLPALIHRTLKDGLAAAAHVCLHD